MLDPRTGLLIVGRTPADVRLITAVLEQAFPGRCQTVISYADEERGTASWASTTRPFRRSWPVCPIRIATIPDPMAPRRLLIGRDVSDRVIKSRCP